MGNHCFKSSEATGEGRGSCDGARVQKDAFAYSSKKNEPFHPSVIHQCADKRTLSRDVLHFSISPTYSFNPEQQERDPPLGYILNGKMSSIQGSHPLLHLADRSAYCYYLRRHASVSCLNSLRLSKNNKHE